tara:strand:+ start:560 stop:1573 length:1014 start_codon:yes stop_codon:yes gene_type:complete
VSNLIKKNQVKDILVLGGTRYFGRSIVEEMLAAGHRVTIFTRGNLKPNFLSEVTHIIGDRMDFPLFRELFENKYFDAVIDNIGYLPAVMEETLNVFKGKVGVYIYTSSISTYCVDEFKPSLQRYHERDTLKEEDYKAVPGKIVDINSVEAYCIGKNQCESKLMQNKSLPYVILRPPLVIGPDDHSRNLYFFMQRILDGGPILLPQHAKQNLLHIYEKDLARAYPKLLEKESYWNQAYNITGEEVLTAEEYLGFIANHLEKKLFITYFPQAELDTIYYIQPFEFNLISDTSKIQENIGVELTPFKKWMSETIDWYLNIYDGPDSKGYDKRQLEIGLSK